MNSEFVITEEKLQKLINMYTDDINRIKLKIKYEEKQIPDECTNFVISDLNDKLRDLQETNLHIERYIINETYKTVKFVPSDIDKKKEDLLRELSNTYEDKINELIVQLKKEQDKKDKCIFDDWEINYLEGFLKYYQISKLDIDNTIIDESYKTRRFVDLLRTMEL